jgi:RNA polymerase sigma factor (sigma-70 family)
MSTKRPPQSNEESYEALQALFVKIAEGEVELLECDEVWKQVLGDPWFCAEVRLQAVRVVGGNVNDPLCDDISQDVVVKLKVKLSKHVDLGVDAGQLSGHLPGWMGEIIHCACVDTLRRERRHPHDVLTEASAVENPAALEELRLDVAEAIAQLEPREQQVAQFKLGKFTVRETAQALDLSEKQVETSRRKAAKLLRRILAVYLTDR